MGSNGSCHTQISENVNVTKKKNCRQQKIIKGGIRQGRLAFKFCIGVA